MRCPDCGFEYVKNVGEKKKIPQYDQFGSHKNADKKVIVENEKKYHCRKCGWRNK